MDLASLDEFLDQRRHLVIPDDHLDASIELDRGDGVGIRHAQGRGQGGHLFGHHLPPHPATPPARSSNCGARVSTVMPRGTGKPCAAISAFACGFF